MTSLSRHLTISLAASLICFFLLQAALAGMEMRNLTEDSVISRLEDDMEAVLTMLSIQPDEKMVVDWEHIPAIFMRPLSGHYFQIQRGKQIIRSRSQWDSVLPVQEAGVFRAVEGPVNQRLLILSRSYVLHGETILLTVAEDTSELEATSRYFQKRLLALSLGVLLLLLVIQAWVIRRGLKPLSGVRRELQQLERGETEKLRQPVPAEITPLVEEVNRLLMVLQHRLLRSRNAMGNLSHALKTPLTVMFQILERRQDDRDCVQLLEQAQRIEGHINRELSRAKTAGQSPGGIWLQPEQDVRDLVSTLEAVHHRQSINIELKIAAITAVSADREDMMELIGNLIDNACKWARGRVLLEIYQRSGLYIIIEDDGPGMKPEELLPALERGMRMDEAKQGHGLGLAIVQEIVNAYNGRVDLGRSDALGGLKISVFFPPPRAD
ncbi:MAG: GHKL domain-containing protein [Mariprofundaceae bacterium]|nr:GHKL domain-containing protein [Mariprofundaceae bacterium]